MKPLKKLVALRKMYLTKHNTGLLFSKQKHSFALVYILREEQENLLP
jgi:hypothetical protein